MEINFEVGDLCTVAHHYGHTRINDQMTILAIEPGESFKSGIKVQVDGLEKMVDSSLIVPKPFIMFRVRYAEMKGEQLRSYEIKGYCDHDARLRFRRKFPAFYISSVKQTTWKH